MSSNLNELTGLLKGLNTLQAQATKQAEIAINSLNGKISQEEFKELKNLTNFEGINNLEQASNRVNEILTRVK